MASVLSPATSPHSGIMPAPAVSAACATLDNYLLYPDHALAGRIAEARERLGRAAVILGHHYQRDEVVRFADFRGDSLQLSRQAAASQADHIVFCGVHFMAESADLLRRPHQKVLLPDLQAGCSMADMASLDQVEQAWEELERLQLADEVLPVAYVNSTAAIKAFCGRHGGLTCTSANARQVLSWAWARKPKILFLPDQHLGRNTAHDLGVALDEMLVWNPRQAYGGNSWERLRQTRIWLWQGHCSVHARFQPRHVEQVRADYPGVKVLVHPECPFEVVQRADLSGSTEFIIRQITQAPAGSIWAVGTEVHLVHRLARENPHCTVLHLDAAGCPWCSTMFRITPAHLCWTLEQLLAGRAVNVITVPEANRAAARLALDRMLQLAV